MDSGSVSRREDARGRKPGEASPPSSGEIARYWSKHPDMLAGTLREAMSGRS